MLNYNSTRKKTVDYINKNCGGTADTSNLAKLNMGKESDTEYSSQTFYSDKSKYSVILYTGIEYAPDSGIGIYTPNADDGKIRLGNYAEWASYGNSDNFWEIYNNRNQLNFTRLDRGKQHVIRLGYPSSGDAWILTDKNVKTLFGNKSIFGTGNIDLYKHNLTVSGYGHNFYGDFYSSKNIECNSLANLKTILGDTFKLPMTGAASTGALGSGYYIGLYLDENALNVANTTEVKTISYDAITITDTITAI